MTNCVHTSIGAVLCKHAWSERQTKAGNKQNIQHCFSTAFNSGVVATGAVKEDYGQETVEGVVTWVASKALAALQAEAKAGQGAVKVRLDGKDVALKVGRHLFWNAACQ